MADPRREAATHSDQDKNPFKYGHRRVQPHRPSQSVVRPITPPSGLNLHTIKPRASGPTGHAKPRPQRIATSNRSGNCPGLVVAHGIPPPAAVASRRHAPRVPRRHDANLEGPPFTARHNPPRSPVAAAGRQAGRPAHASRRARLAAIPRTHPTTPRILKTRRSQRATTHQGPSWPPPGQQAGPLAWHRSQKPPQRVPPPTARVSKTCRSRGTTTHQDPHGRR
jgi:hypothetical protein